MVLLSTSGNSSNTRSTSRHNLLYPRRILHSRTNALKSMVSVARDATVVDSVQFCAHFQQKCSDQENTSTSSSQYLCSFLTFFSSTSLRNVHTGGSNLLKFIVVMCVVASHSYTAYELNGMSVKDLAQVNLDVLDLQKKKCDVDRGQQDDLCSKIDYVLKYNSFRQDYEQSNNFKKQHRLHEITTVDSTMEYRQVFEDYMMKNRPFLSSTTESLIDPTSFELCESPSQFTHDYALHRCAKSDEFKDVSIPRILKNSFNLRLLDESKDDNVPLNVGKDWPSVISVRLNNSVPIHSCPARMHQVLWGQNDTMVVRLFLKSNAAQLNPEFGGHDELLHYPKFNTESFPSSGSSNFPKYTETILEKGQYIFVPETYLLGLGVPDVTPVNSFRMCFVDASNLKAFRDEMSLDAKVSPHARDVLLKLSSSSFDLSMQRDPKEFTLRTMHTGLSTSKYASPMDEISEEESPTVTDASGGSRRNQRNRKTTGGKFRGNFKSAVTYVIFSQSYHVLTSSLSSTLILSSTSSST